jgi:predicted ATPase
MAQTISLRVHQLRGETSLVAGQANAAIALCEEHEFVHYRAMAMILRGWATAQQGEFERGIAEIREGLENERTMGALLFDSYSLGLLADASIKNKQYKQATDFLIEAQSRLDEENSSRFYAAEIFRLRGEVHLRSGSNLDQAEHYFSKGLKVAREQGAKSLELRLCLSMCDLHVAGPSAGKWRAKLGEVYESFTEGYETADLMRAKERLQALAK